VTFNTIWAFLGFWHFFYDDIIVTYFFRVAGMEDDVSTDVSDDVAGDTDDVASDVSR